MFNYKSMMAFGVENSFHMHLNSITRTLSNINYDCTCIMSLYTSDIYVTSVTTRFFLAFFHVGRDRFEITV